MGTHQPMSQHLGWIWVGSGLGKRCSVTHMLPKHLLNFGLFGLILQGCLEASLCWLSHLKGLHEATWDSWASGEKFLSLLAVLSWAPSPSPFQWAAWGIPRQLGQWGEVSVPAQLSQAPLCRERDSLKGTPSRIPFKLAMWGRPFNPLVLLPVLWLSSLYKWFGLGTGKSVQFMVQPRTPPQKCSLCPSLVTVSLTTLSSPYKGIFSRAWGWLN